MAKVCVLGGGSIGLYLAGTILNGSKKSKEPTEVGLLTRPRVLEAIQQKGFLCSDLKGSSNSFSDSEFSFIDTNDLQSTDSKKRAGEHNIFLVCVKTADSANIANVLLGLVPHLVTKPALVVSCQNGMGNANALRSILPSDEFTVVASVVGFNVIWEETHHVHRATTNPFVVEAVPSSTPHSHLLPALQDTLTKGGCKTLLSDDIVAHQWGKLCINLNNAINALSGTRLNEQFSNQGYRNLLVLQFYEALQVLERKKIRASGTLPPNIFVYLLCIPHTLLNFLKPFVIKIDDSATSSMQQDLVVGRQTEVRELQGKIIQMGEEVSFPTPVCSTIMRLVEEASVAKRGSPKLSDVQIFEEIHKEHKNFPKAESDRIIFSHQIQVYKILFVLFSLLILVPWATYLYFS